MLESVLALTPVVAIVMAFRFPVLGVVFALLPLAALGVCQVLVMTVFRSTTALLDAGLAPLAPPFWTWTAIGMAVACTGLIAAGGVQLARGQRVSGGAAMLWAACMGSALLLILVVHGHASIWNGLRYYYMVSVFCFAAPLAYGYTAVRSREVPAHEAPARQPVSGMGGHRRDVEFPRDAAVRREEQPGQPAPPPELESSAASAPPPAAAAGHGQAHGANFDVSLPTRNLSSIAGMTALKAELEPVLAKFRPWAGAHTNPNGPKPEPVDRNGILFTGPPGNGKSTMAEAIAGELKLPLLRIGVQDLTSKWLNESSEKIAAVVSEAIAIAPCVLFIDEIDAIAPRRDGYGAHQENNKGVNTLLQQIDRLRKKCVLLIAATNYLENMDPAVVRDGRFDFRIEIPWPDEEARYGIFTALAAQHGVAMAETVARKCAHRWERRSAAFIENVVKRLRDMPGALSEGATAAMVRQADRAVSKRAGNLPRAGAKLSELQLLPDVRRQADSIINRLAHWDEIADQGGTPPRGILLYGPPGTGKTHLVSAMARELGEWHVFEVRTSEIMADPRSFSKVIDLASTHRPAFIFIDEADDLLKDRSTSFNATATNEILKAIDGTMGAIPEVVFVAATNNPDAIDAAAKRSGRFSEKLFLDLFRGDDLVVFIRHHLERHGDRLQLDQGISPEAIAAILGAAGPADVVGVLNTAVNATFDGTAGAGKRRAVTLDDIQRAVDGLRAT